jgi:hypothetical protein
MPSSTNTAAIDRASDRSFKADLNAFLDNEAALERHAELIEQYAHDLIQAGQEFYPWTLDHFEEAMIHAPSGNRIAVFATIAAAVDLDLKNDLSNHMALVAVRQLMERYWLDCAMQKAEEN